MSEAQFQRMIEELAQWMGLSYYHTWTSVNSVAGFPDLVIVGQNGLIYRELKAEKGRVSPAQKYWLEILTQAGEDAKVWRPSDLLNARSEMQKLGRILTPQPVKKPRKMGKSRAI